MSKPNLFLPLVIGPLCFGAGVVLSSDPDRAPRQSAATAVAPKAAPVVVLGDPAPVAVKAAATHSVSGVVEPAPPAQSQPKTQRASVLASTSEGFDVVALTITPDKDPKRATLYRRLAETCRRLDYEGEARRFLRAALAADPTNMDILRDVKEHDPGAFQAAILAAVKLKPLEFLSEVAHLDRALAEATAREILADDPSNPRALLALIRWSRAEGLDALRAARSADPENYQLLDLLAGWAPEEAWPIIQRGLAEDPNDDGLLSFAVDAALNLDDPTRAAPLIEAALTGVNGNAKVALLDLLAQVDPASAIAHYEGAGSPAADPDQLHFLAEAYFKLGRTQDGLRFAERVVAMETAADGDSFLLSILLDDEENPEIGIQLAHQLVAADPMDRRVRYDLLHAYDNYEREAELLQTARTWIETATRASQAHDVASTLEDMERYELAAAAYRRAHLLDPADPEALTDLAHLEPTSALELLEPLLAQSPRKASLRYVLKAALRVLAENTPSQVVAALDGFPDDSIQRDVAFLDELADDCSDHAETAADRAAARTLWTRAERLDPNGNDRDDRIAELAETR